MKDDLLARIMAALDEPDGLKSDPELAEAVKRDPEVATLWRDYAFLDGALRAFPTVTPSRDVWTAIQGRLDAQDAQDEAGQHAGDDADHVAGSAAGLPQRVSALSDEEAVSPPTFEDGGLLRSVPDPAPINHDDRVHGRTTSSTDGTDPRGSENSGGLGAVLGIGTAVVAAAAVLMLVVLNLGRREHSLARQYAPVPAASSEGSAARPTEPEQDLAPEAIGSRGGVFQGGAAEEAATSTAAGDSVGDGQGPLGRRQRPARALGNARARRPRRPSGSAMIRGGEAAVSRERTPLDDEDGNRERENQQSGLRARAREENRLENIAAEGDVELAQPPASPAMASPTAPRAAPSPAPSPQRAPGVSGAGVVERHQEAADPGARDGAASATGGAPAPESSSEAVAAEEPEPSRLAPTRTEIGRALRQLTNSVRGCLPPGTRGSIPMRIRFESRGRVDHVRLTGPWARRPESRCVVRVLRGARVEPFENRHHEMEYRLAL